MRSLARCRVRSFGGDHLALRAYALAAMALLAIFCGMVALRLNGAFRTPRIAPLAAGWLPLFALMTLLTAPGVQTAFLRAFSECFVVGCLIVAFSHRRRYGSAGR